MALFKKDKDQKKKGQEGLIGKIIYACLLFAPIIAIFVKCGYVMFNKNAYKSYTGDYTYLYSINLNKYKIQNNITYDSFEVSGQTNYYYEFPILKNEIKANSNNLFGVNQNSSNGYAYGLNVLNLTFRIDDTIYTHQNCFITFSTNRVPQNNGRIAIYENLLFDQTTSYITKTYDQYENFYIQGTLINPTATYTNTNSRIQDLSFIGYDNYIYFTSMSNTTSINETLSRYDTDLYFTDTALSNVFMSATKDVEKAELFNWAKETGTYTVLQTTCNGLGITNTFTPFLMAYWLIISIIYFLFDIALILIWAVHDKIHELKESI